MCFFSAVVVAVVFNSSCLRRHRAEGGVDIDSLFTISTAHCLLNFFEMLGTSRAVWRFSSRGTGRGDAFYSLYHRPLFSFGT